MPHTNAAKEFEFANQPHDLEWMMVDARRRQSEAARKLAAQTNKWFLRLTGLGAFGHFVTNSVIDPLRVSMLRRRTLANLQQLDDRVLADIGIERAILAETVNQLIDRKSIHGTNEAPASAAKAAPAAQTPEELDDIEYVTSVAAITPKAAANCNRTSHRAA